MIGDHKPRHPESARVELPQTVDSTHWGDRLIPLEDSSNITRILSLNVRGIPPILGSPRLQHIKTIVTRTQTDICAFSEINTNWSRVTADCRLPNSYLAGRLNDHGSRPATSAILLNPAPTISAAPLRGHLTQPEIVVRSKAATAVV